MKAELIQLLQSDEQHNIILGCYLARSNGYSDVDIFEQLRYTSGNMELKEGIFPYISYHIKNLSFQIWEEELVRFNVVDLGDDGDILLIRKVKCNKDDEIYNRTKIEFAKYFIECIFNL